MSKEPERDREFVFSRADFIRVRDELYDYAGIVLADHKQDMAYNRLVRRLRELKLNSFAEYFEHLDKNPAEFSQFINALTTNLTAFFRERHHFEFIRDTILPEIKASGQRRLRGWSAGCSLGEEPYSLAITLCEAGVDTTNWDVRLLATDIDSKVLGSAQAGIYAHDRLKALPQAQIRRWFMKGKGKNQGQVKVRPELQKMLTFKYLNLMQDWPMQGPLDFIFCRNVMIYFDQNTQTNLLERMAQLLKPNGYLFVGHSESLARQAKMFELVGKTIYRKVG
ncbi:CheR family methyltransferase [Neptuniibacter halophilus]|uniref:CheR family methyltransferase n=1 Tax=Neptuniibacter halophilus TaxID=651666 RepID=UPI002573ACB8|nr:protein-glutamate O-methyltransferase CheR [Neptuniibacter halophilus]